MSLTRIILYGPLRKFGREFRKDVSSAAEAVVALRNTVPGFKDYLLKHPDSHFRVMVGYEDKNESTLYDPCGKKIIRIVPLVSGAKDEGMQFLTGAALTIAGVMVGAATPWGSRFITIGLSMMVGGAAQMLARTPTATIVPNASKGPEDTPTYSFTGPHMTLGQGNPVPVLLGGPLRIGGALVSIGLCPESYQDKGLGNAAADNAGTRAGDGDTSPYVWAIAPVA